jgi:methylmalonyl-CoA/ethylmalonyl-CoA epimerase
LIDELKFHHLGIATADLQGTVGLYSKLGFQRSEVIHDPLQKVQICFLSKSNHPLLELIAPADDTSPVNTILQKAGTSPYHSCYEVTDLEERIAEFRNERFLLVVKPVRAIAFENRRVCFLYHPQIGLIELLEQA